MYDPRIENVLRSLCMLCVCVFADHDPHPINPPLFRVRAPRFPFATCAGHRMPQKMDCEACKGNGMGTKDLHGEAGNLR